MRWDVVVGWSPFARDAVGHPLVRAADRIGANVAEGHGRGSVPDNRRLVRVARGSLKESVHLLRGAHRRHPMPTDWAGTLSRLPHELGPKPNVRLRSTRTDAN